VLFVLLCSAQGYQLYTGNGFVIDNVGVSQNIQVIQTAASNLTATLYSLSITEISQTGSSSSNTYVIVDPEPLSSTGWLINAGSASATISSPLPNSANIFVQYSYSGSVITSTWTISSWPFSSASNLLQIDFQFVWDNIPAAINVSGVGATSDSSGSSVSFPSQANSQFNGASIEYSTAATLDDSPTTCTVQGGFRVVTTPSFSAVDYRTVVCDSFTDSLVLTGPVITVTSGLQLPPPSVTQSSSSSSSSHGHKLSGGVIAAIVLCCIVGVALLVGVAIFVFVKYRSGEGGFTSRSDKAYPEREMYDRATTAH